jgi:hypothetical protein
MNVAEINPGTKGTLSHYFAVTFPLTIITAWVVIAFQSTYLFKDDTHFIKRLGWPAYLLLAMIGKKLQKGNDSDVSIVISGENSLSSAEIKQEYMREHLD